MSGRFIRFSMTAFLVGLFLAEAVAGSRWPVRADGNLQHVSFAQARDKASPITLKVNQSSIIQFDQALSRVSIAQPAVADSTIISPTQLMLIGKSIGTSSLTVWNATEPDQPVSFELAVVANIQPLVDQISKLLPGESISVEQVEGRAILSGPVSSPSVIETIAPLFEGTGLRVVNLTHVPGAPPPKQVMLQVRVAEVNRRILREVGVSFSWLNPLNPRGQNEGIVGSNQFTPPIANFATVPIGPNFTFSDAVNLFFFNPGTSLGVFIRALQQRNAFRSLAEPNIIAVNGAKASFLAGGEFPYPVVQPSTAGLAITIQFREFGVRLNFTPTILEDGRIRLELGPEVSALDFANALQLSGFRVPGLVSRKALTTVELADGQSFALAGLLNNEFTKVDSKVPLLGDIPILGYLFKSQSYIRNESELVFLCTARLVQPVSVEELPAIPGQEEWKQEGFEGPFGHRAPQPGEPGPKP